METVRGVTYDLADALKVVFKKHHLRNREKAWEILSKNPAKEIIAGLAKHPDRSLNVLDKLNFKEWMESRAQNSPGK